MKKKTIGLFLFVGLAVVVLVFALRLFSTGHKDSVNLKLIYTVKHRELDVSASARWSQDIRTVQALLAEGADPNIRDEVDEVDVSSSLWQRLLAFFKRMDTTGGQKATHYTAFRIALGGESINEDIVKLLVDHGADVNARDKEGRTPLLVVSEGGHTNVMRLLLDRGADVNAKDSYGDTALCNQVYASYENTRLLIERGADVNVTDKIGRTPLLGAVEQGDLSTIRLLLEKGASVKANALKVAKANNDKKVITLLQQYGIDALSEHTGDQK